MNTIQWVYCQARELNNRLETEALRRLKETEAFHTLPPDWDRIVTQQEQIEQALGLPHARKILEETTLALELFAIMWMNEQRTPEQTISSFVGAPITLQPRYYEPFLEVCMNLPESHESYPVPAFIQELAAFFEQQQQAAEDALRQNYALHESHLAFLEHALAHIQADRPEEAEATLLCFYTEEQQRLKDQARLQSILGREEQSPHRERHEALLHQLSKAIQQPRLRGEEEERP